MTRTPAKVTQADVARAVRAALQAGAGGVEIRPDGSIFIHIVAPASPQAPQKPLEPRPPAVL
jgi:hypothetical protein